MGGEELARGNTVHSGVAATLARRPRRKTRIDDLFFSGMALVSLIVILTGFARTYFLAGLFRAPLPNLLLDIHGAAFTLWIVLFVGQVGLVSVRRVSVHRRLGLVGFGLAVLMLILGLLAASDQLARHSREPGKETPQDVRAFYAVPMGDMLMFVVFTSMGYRYRSNPAVHKRLMLFATFALLDAGFDRWSVFDPYPLWLVNLICFGPLILATIAWDWWSSRRVQRVTIWAIVFFLAVAEMRHFLGYTAAWQGLAAWVAIHTPTFR